jgi:Spx/MgsR family transcriptional regulator
MIKIYGIKNCDSVKKAIKFLKVHTLAYELIDFKITPVDCKKVQEWLQKTTVTKLFNTRSTSYRNLKLKEKNLTDEQKAEWLCKENLLIKRPVIEFGEKLIVGYNEQEYLTNFLNKE